jgi:lipopolysaccharide heptosyltransferase II
MILTMNKGARLVKLIDSIIGPFCVRIVSRRSTIGYPFETGKILFLRPGGIGDAVLLIPAIQAVKRVFPSANIHVLAEERNAEVLSLCPEVERVFHYTRLPELVSVIREKYDVVIDTEQWHRLSAVVARLGGAPISLGFATNDRKKLFTHPAPYSHDDYEIESFLRLVEPIAEKAVFDRESPFVVVSEKDREKVEPLLDAVSKRQFVSLFPGGTIPERRWGSDRFHDLAVALSENGYGAVVIGGKSDVRAGEDIIRGVPEGINLAGKLSLRESAAVINLSSLLVTGDSGILHLGYAVGSKVVALFGPGIEKKWAPRSSRVRVINKGLPCSPCTRFGYTPKCPRNAECMKTITVEEVLENITELMNS